MKNILYILLTLSILSTGCSEEDDNLQPETQISTTNLDSDLYGVWDRGSQILTLSSNGKYILIDTWDNGGYSGDWWVEGNYLILGHDNIQGLGGLYSVQGITLSYLGYNWLKL